jgi:DNA-binding transcriptional MerR regulator
LKAVFPASGLEGDVLPVEPALERGDDVIDETYTIADLAREFDVTTRTIRFYEDKGLLAPERQGQARVYHVREHVRLKLILRGKRLGFSLKEIGEILDLYDSEPGEVAQLQLFLQKIEERRVLLAQQREDIDVILAELDAAEIQCRQRLAARLGKRRTHQRVASGKA